MKNQKTLTLKTLSKSNVWDIQETDVFRLLSTAEKDTDLKENMRRYVDIIRSAFEIEDVKDDNPVIKSKLEARGFKVGKVRDGDKIQNWALKKRPILRVTDLTYENIRHISASKLIEVLERNFGGGWESLPQAIQDIINSGFDISTTTLPKDRLHKAGGMYENKMADGFEVLEVAKGSWVEAIFAKEKPEMEKPRLKIEKDELSSKIEDLGDEDAENEDVEDEDEEDVEDEESEDSFDDDDDAFDDDKLTEESYRTTYDTNPEDLNMEAEDITDDEDGY